MSNSSSNDKRGQLMGLSLFVLFGLIAAAVGIYLLAGRISDKKRCTEPVPAVVVELEKRTSHRSKGTRVTYAPVFEYEYRGNTYRYVSPISSKPAAYEVGERTTLMIDPNDPNVAYVRDKTAQTFIIVCLAFGVIFAAFGGIGIKMTLSGTKAKNTLEK